MQTKKLKIYGKEVKTKDGRVFVRYTFTPDGKKFYKVKFTKGSAFQPSVTGYCELEVNRDDVFITQGTTYIKENVLENDTLWVRKVISFSKIVDEVKNDKRNNELDTIFN